MPLSEADQLDGGEATDGGDKPPLDSSFALLSVKTPSPRRPDASASPAQPPHASSRPSNYLCPPPSVPALHNGHSRAKDQSRVPGSPLHPRSSSVSGASSREYSSDSDSVSADSSRPPSRVGNLLDAPKLAQAKNGKSDGSNNGGSSAPPSRPPSVKSLKSDDGAAHKFNLKDLLASGPKLRRRNSNRSDSSGRKSDSEHSSSDAPETTASFLKKYGVCGRAAIGKGATSVVRLAHKWDRTEEKLYAVKEFRKRRKNETEKEYVKKLTSEFCISSTLHHTNIVETVDLVQDENHNWCEVMEYCPGGDLYAVIKKGRMQPAEIECCFKQLLSGVAYLHSQGVAHRDIKPENLFFDGKGHLKIGDYGASTVYRLPWEVTVHKSTGLCGSEPYIAPEQFSNAPYDARLVDVWACGIVFYCMQFQEIPWRVAQMTDQLYGQYAQACATSPNNCPPTIQNLQPRACRPLIRKMLEPDPKMRTLIEDVVNHAWVQGIEVCTNPNKKAKHTHVLNCTLPDG